MQSRCAEPPYAELRAELRTELRAELRAELPLPASGASQPLQ